MLWLYNIAIQFYGLIVRFFSLFNHKAKLFVDGRVNVFEQISKQVDSSKKHIWFHYASLGEFEQGRTVMEKIKLQYPKKEIVITFFSPSGYEIRKNYPLAQGTFYLPLDTAKNARKLIEALNPEIAIFTKYEYWYHYFNTLNKKNIPIILISSIFRVDQVFFKWYGSFNRSILKFVDHFFVQNHESVDLLKTIGIENVTLGGDTRFDRVFENAGSTKNIEAIDHFLNDADVLVAGSTWPADEDKIVKLIELYPDWKFIIAPHEIDVSRTTSLKKLIPNSVKFSELSTNSSAQVLVIDNIGMLSTLYRYGKIAYVGGGFGVGIHNTLEAAAFGIPIIFGPNYQKFQEARDLIEIGAAKSVKTETELVDAFDILLQNYSEAGLKAKQYVSSKKGATLEILDYVSKLL